MGASTTLACGKLRVSGAQPQVNKQHLGMPGVARRLITPCKLQKNGFNSLS